MPSKPHTLTIYRKNCGLNLATFAQVPSPALDILTRESELRFRVQRLGSEFRDKIGRHGAAREQARYLPPLPWVFIEGYRGL